MNLKLTAVLLGAVFAGTALADPASQTVQSNSAQNVSVSAPAPAATSTTTASKASNTKATTASPAVPAALATDKSKISYTLGVDMGRNLKAQNLSMDPSLFAKGISDGMAGGPFLLSDAQMKQAIDTFKKTLMAKQEENRKQTEAQQKAMGAQNASEGSAFLAKNKTAAGVQSMPDGLQYKSLTQGSGATPTLNDTVTVDYEGRLLNGTVFDSSYKQGQPVTFKVGEVINGWQEALTHMKTGDVWEVYIPPELAYGDRGVGGPIGPNQTLVFKIHLITVKPAAAAAAQSQSALPATQKKS